MKGNANSNLIVIILFLFLQKRNHGSDADQNEPGCCQLTVPSLSKIRALIMKNLIKMWRNMT